MTDHHTPVTQDELHAYIDGELPADRRDAVEAWLATHPEDAALVAAWRAQSDVAINAQYGHFKPGNAYPTDRRSGSDRYILSTTLSF